MPNPPPLDVILERLRSGDRNAVEELLPHVYQELRAIAAIQMRRERPDHTLQPTALVHEAYVKLTERSGLALQDRGHFFAVAARAMRQVLVDHARRRKTEKRGEGHHRESLSKLVPLAPSGDAPDVDLLALDSALNSLAEHDERKARALELRYFAGLNVDETAEVLGLHVRTVERDWKYGLAWLTREMGASADEE